LTAPLPCWGSYAPVIAQWIERSRKTSLVQRLWEKDASLWAADTAPQREIRNRLGWLDVVSPMKELAGDLALFSKEIKEVGYSQLLLLGMGGSSLAPEVFQHVFGPKAGYPKLLILDSTDPERVRDVEKAIDLQKTLFIVSSKSGGTVELISFFRYFFDKVRSARGENAGKHFIAITDPGTELETLAKTNHFRRVFLAPEDVGGRFSALTYFGLVPAALIGVDVSRLLDGAWRMMEKVSPNSGVSENAALTLGIGMAVLAEEKRDKLTILTSSTLRSFGDWLEQLIAESTGKEEMGIVPIVGEPPASPETYGEDRFFVALTLESDPKEELETLLSALQKAGHPCLTFRLDDAYELGAEFFKWEMAVAIACALLKINAFDQPDVQAAKDKTKALLQMTASGKPPSVKTSGGSFNSFWKAVQSGDYLGILAFLPDREPIRKKLAELQSLLRDRTRAAVTLGIGPRYLHSTGQLHKGGPNTGLFLMITSQAAEGLPIPGEKFSFADLELAQAMGDLEALEAKGRRVFHVRLNAPSVDPLDDLIVQVQKSE